MARVGALIVLFLVVLEYATGGVKELFFLPVGTIRSFLLDIRPLIWILILVGLFPGGFRDVGWKREKWGWNALLGVLLYLFFRIAGGLVVLFILWLVPEWERAFPGWKRLFALPPVQDGFRELVDALLTGIWEETFLFFLFVRFQKIFPRRAYVPWILVIAIDVIGHIEEPPSWFYQGKFEKTIPMLAGIVFRRTVKLLVFQRTRHIGAPVISHFLWDFL